MLNIESRIIKFPPDCSLGKVSLRSVENPREWNRYADARGQLVVPLDRDVWLSVSYEAMSNLTPLYALAATDLQVLSITCTRRFDDAQLRHIENLTGLIGLALWETETGDAAFSHLSGLSNLRWLDIGDTQITDEGLAFIQGMSDLEELTLLNTHISNAGLRHLDRLKKLKRLDLMGTKVDDASFEILGGLNGLESLRIMDTGISYPTFAKLKRALPNCQITYVEFARI
jgi:Leucine-rich repeat (LRR) protein